MNKKNIALVMGGYSGEHDISILSGCQVYDNLDHDKYNVYKIVVERDGWYWLADDGTHRPVNRDNFTIQGVARFDLAFIIIHGNPGENGVLQGYFDMLGIPYTTCGFYTSSLTFHKGFCNPVVKSFGIVSVATTKVKEPAALLPAIQEAFTEDSQVLVEECITGREFDCGVFRTKEQKLVFPITEIILFFFYSKYQGFSNDVTPAQCDEQLARHIQEVSAQLYDLLNCRGIVRFDYIYDTARNELFFLEVNTIPGQSAESIVPKQARSMGISTRQLYEMVIQSSLND